MTMHAIDEATIKRFEGKSVKPSPAFRAAIGATDADDGAEVLRKVNAATQFQRDVLAATGASDLSGVKAKIAQMRSDIAKLPEAEARLADAMRQHAEAEAERYVFAAVDGGRLHESLRDEFVGNARRYGIGWAEATIDAMQSPFDKPKASPITPASPAPGPVGRMPSARDLELVELTAAEYREWSRKARAAGWL